jgi:hypothetical protein
MMNAQQFWSEHLATIQFQGVSASAYAKQLGLALASLYYWQRKLRAAAAAPRTVSTAATTAPSKAPGQFITLSIGDTLGHGARPAMACTLVLAGGVQLQMSALPDPQWLLAVGRSAQGAC